MLDETKLMVGYILNEIDEIIGENTNTVTIGVDDALKILELIELRDLNKNLNNIEESLDCTWSKLNDIYQNFGGEQGSISDNLDEISSRIWNLKR